MEALCCQGDERHVVRARGQQRIDATAAIDAVSAQEWGPMVALCGMDPALGASASADSSQRTWCFTVSVPGRA